MTGSPDAQRVKAQQTKHWNGVAAGWAAWIDWTERNFSPLTDWFVDKGGWLPGARVLDVACGAGYPAFAAAARVEPGGTVVACDISSSMIAVASDVANVRGANNIDFRAMDAEELEFEDASFDAVTNAYGLMFCPDPLRAILEARRVLRSGGRVAFATWDELAKNPFFSLITPVAARHLSLTAPKPGAPGPFRFSSPEELGAMLQGAGLTDVAVESRPMTVEFESVDQYCQIFTDVAWKSRVASLQPAQLNAFRDEVDRTVQPYVVGNRLRLVTTSLCASGRKAQR